MHILTEIKIAYYIAQKYNEIYIFTAKIFNKMDLRIDV